MSHLFVSYSSSDRRAVRKLSAKLNRQGFETWLDTTGLQGGQAWSEELARKLSEAEAVLLMISPDSVRSQEVRREVDLARERGVRLLPLLLRPTPSMELLEYQLSGTQRIDLTAGARASRGWSRPSVARGRGPRGPRGTRSAERSSAPSSA